MMRHIRTNKGIESKITLFKNEVGGRCLTDEQRRLYGAFTRTKGSKPLFIVNDKDGRTVQFRIDPTKVSDGPQHILTKHYRETIGRVTALEILNMCDVIRQGSRRITARHTVYQLTRIVGGARFTLALKLTKKDYVLKSFYSNRK